jgi:hypothetical protein
MSIKDQADEKGNEIVNDSEKDSGQDCLLERHTKQSIYSRHGGFLYA